MKPIFAAVAMSGLAARLVLGPSHWTAIVFVAYVTFGVAVIWIDALQVAKTRTRPHEAMMAARAGGAKSSWFDRVRGRVGHHLEAAEVLLHWPAAVIDTLRRGRAVVRSPMHTDAAYRLDPPDLSSSAIALGLILAVAGVLVLGTPSPLFAKSFLMVLVSGIAVRHARYLVTGSSLPESLRRSRYKPYLGYFLVLCADIIGVAVALCLIQPGVEINQLSSGDFLDSAMRVFQFKTNIPRSFRDLWRYETVILTVGFLVSGSVVRNLIRFKEFQRTNEDYVAVAWLHNRLGEFQRAREYIAKTGTRLESGVSADVLALMGLDELERAHKTVIDFLPAREYPTGSDSAWMFMASLGQMGAVPKLVRQRMVDLMLASDASDMAMLSAVGFAQQAGADTLGLIGELASKADKYPLTLADLHVHAGNLGTATALLDNATLPSPTEQIVRENIRFWHSLSDATAEEERQAIERWLDQGFPLIRKLLPEVVSYWNRILVAGYLQRYLAAVRSRVPARSAEVDAAIADFHAAQDTRPKDFDVFAAIRAQQFPTVQDGA
jgi:hypothetical protein